MDIQTKLAGGLELHQAGHLLEAGEIYREILGVDPDNVDALNLMGIVMQAAGDLDLAIDLIGRATELAPDYFAPFANLGNAFQAANRLDEAVEMFRKALELNPDSPETANNLASVFNELGRHDEALGSSEAALKLLEDFPAAQINRGNALAGLGKSDQAIECYRQILAENPTAGDCWYNLGNVYADIENWSDACEAYRKALAFDVSNPEKHYNLAIGLLKDDRFEDAAGSFAEALRLSPDYIDAHCNMASALQSLGRTEEAIGNLRRALIEEPDSADLHWNLALISIQHGEFQQGWKEYEWRWKTPTFADFKREFPKPQWKGETLTGKTVLVTAEQGFGDGIQFARYASLLNERGASVVLECRPQLRRLFETLEGVEKCIDLGSVYDEYDFYVPLMSLPHLFGTTLESIPGQSPYLSTSEDVHPHEILAESETFKVGFAWAGSATRVDNHKRSCDVKLFEPLFALPGIQFFSLQVGEFRCALESATTNKPVYDIADTLGDFADTAAVIDALDLVISVDTSVLHLAGALGKPALGLMSSPTGFLWMNDRTDSPWYPSLKLIRQPSPGNWRAVFEEAERELRSRMVAFLENGR